MEKDFLKERMWHDHAHSEPSTEPYLAFKGIDDELKRMRGYTLDALLNNVVSILVLNTLEDMSV